MQRHRSTGQKAVGEDRAHGRAAATSLLLLTAQSVSLRSARLPQPAKGGQHHVMGELAGGAAMAGGGPRRQPCKAPSQGERLSWAALLFPIVAALI